MSTSDDHDEQPVSRKPLTLREVFDLFLYEKAVRPYLFGALGGLAMTFLILFMNGSDIGGVIVVLFGLSALILRWIASPIFVVLVTCYLQVFPFGIPDDLFNDPNNVRRTHLQPQDVMLVMAVLVYLRCTYRVLGLVHQSMPFESVFRRRGEYPTRRPVGHIEPGEIGWLLGASVGLVFLGQLLWWLANALDFVPADGGIPLRWADLEDGSTRYRRAEVREAGEFGAPVSRFFVMTGGLFFGFLVVRLVFGYWRLRTMTAAEGAMVTTDTSWAESHRERVRVEKWRIWGREKEVEKERRARREEREKQRKEDAKREKAERKAREREREEMEARARRRRRDDDEDEDDRPRRKR